MSRSKKYNREIDEYDLGRIVDKTTLITRMINWLEKLKQLDKTVNIKDINEAIDYLKDKKARLDNKFDNAQKDMIMEAELAAMAFLDDGE